MPSANGGRPAGGAGVATLLAVGADRSRGHPLPGARLRRRRAVVHVFVVVVDVVGLDVDVATLQPLVHGVGVDPHVSVDRRPTPFTAAIIFFYCVFPFEPNWFAPLWTPRSLFGRRTDPIGRTRNQSERSLVRQRSNFLKRRRLAPSE